VPLRAAIELKEAAAYAVGLASAASSNAARGHVVVPDDKLATFSRAKADYEVFAHVARVSVLFALQDQVQRDLMKHAVRAVRTHGCAELAIRPLHSAAVLGVVHVPCALARRWIQSQHK
jgi:hypothetical protein